MLTSQFKPFLTSKHQPRGFTLIEVLVTVVVVSIGLLGLAGIQINGLRANMSSEARGQATQVASDIIERMRANPLGVSANAYANIDSSALACNTPPSPFCSNSRSVTASNCSALQMATFDVWIWGCGMPVSSGIVSSSIKNQLSAGTASVVCIDADLNDTDACSPNSIHTVSVSWDELNLNSREATAAGSTESTATASSGTVNTQTLVLSVVP
jgi:type IV pilus assembly protein PilV